MTDLLFGKVDNYSIGVELKIVTGSITPVEIWEQKDELYEFAAKSKEIWENMTTEQREATLRLVKTGIERIYDRVDEWVPESLQVDGGEYLDVHFRLIFTNIDEEIERHEEVTSFQIKNAQAGTLEKLAAAESDED